MIGRQRSLGIHLGKNTAIFVEAERLFGQVRVIDAGTLDLETGKQNEQGRSEAEPARVHKHSFPRRRVEQIVLSLPRQQTVCRFIDLPNVADEKLEGLLSFEIERHLPFPLEEACYGFQKLSVSGTTARVLVAAAKRADVESAVEKVKRLGVVPTVVDVSAMAAATAMSCRIPVPRDQTIALIQIKGAEATVDVLGNSILVSSRTVPFPQESEVAPLNAENNRPSEGQEALAHCKHNVRVPVEGYLSFTTDQVTGEGTVVNLSRNGLCICSRDPLEVGMLLRLSIAFPHLDEPVEVPMASVRWAAGGKFGLEMAILDNDVRTRIEQELSAYSLNHETRLTKTEFVTPPELVGPAVAPWWAGYRCEFEGYVTFSGDGIDGEGTVVNGSEEGWCILSEQPVKPGMGLVLQIAMSELDEPVEIVGAEVRWARSGEFGIHVEGDGEAIRAALQEYVKASRAAMSKKHHEAEHAGAVLSELQRLASSSIGMPGSILVYGGSDEVCRVLRQEVHVPIEQWNRDAMAQDPVAFGLALRGLKTNGPQLNLLPLERRTVRRDRTATVFCALLGLVMTLAAAWWGTQSLLERNMLVQLDEELAVVKRDAEEVSLLQKEYATLNTHMQVLESLGATQGRSINLLKEVVLLLPPDVLLQELSLDGVKLRLRGSTSASAAGLISAFEHSTLLENAAFTAPISVQGKDRQTFEIAATVRGPLSRVQITHDRKGAS